MEGDAGNALPGSETGITVAGNDQDAPTVPEIPENIQENNENGNQDTLKDGYTEEETVAVANVATTVLQPDEKREPDVGEAEQEQEKPTVEETEAGGDPEPHGSPLGGARRERKKVEPLTIDAPKMHTSSTKVVVGKGTRLRDIPNVAFKLSKITGRDELMESLHNVLYRRKGTLTTRKKLILEFSGFEFDEGQEEKEIESRRSSLNKLNLNIIHQMMNVLDLNRGSGDKEAKIDRILEFLKSPCKTSDTDLGAKDAARKEKNRRKRERANAKKEKEKKKKKKMKTSQETKQQKHKEQEPEQEQIAEEDTSDDDDDDPALELSTADIEIAIEEIFAKLDRQQLETVTGKHALKKLSEHYGFSMQSRKPEIVNLASSYIARRLVVEEEKK